jgi:hypothetical protein
MLAGLRKFTIFLLSALLLVCFAKESPAADDVFRLEFYSDSRKTIDSTRKDYYLAEPVDNASSPAFTRSQYDRNFISTQSDMFLTVRGDLNEGMFLDLKEKLFWQYYNNEDYYSQAINSKKLKQIDHEFNLTFGIAAGDYDYFQLDYFNNYYDTEWFEQWQIKSNKATGEFSHKFSERNILSISGGYEEREYPQDDIRNFRKGSVGLEFITFIKGSQRYIQLASSARGKRSYFENFPNGLSAAKAVKYYTDFTRHPDDDDPDAKYKIERSSGDMYLRFYGDAATKERTELSNRCVDSGLGLEVNYELSPELALRIDDYYRKIDWRNESQATFLFDHYLNRLKISADYEYSPNFAQSVAFINETTNNTNFSSENFNQNKLSYDAYYFSSRSRASISLAGLRKRFDENRVFYSDEDEMQFAAAYDYLITRNLKFLLRTWYIDKDCLNFESLYQSSYQRNSWRASLEKILSRHHSLEIAYQENSERHKQFTENNLDEKSLNFTWLSSF